MVKPSIAVNVPPYNDPTEYHAILRDAASRGLSEYLKAIWRVHEMRVRDTLRALEEAGEWRLFMTWLDLADLLGHTCMGRRRLELMRGYMELNKLAGRLQGMVPRDTVFLIISDHGMRLSEDLSLIHI